MATIKDVAAKAGVSISTVSRVLNESQNVSSELQTKVLSAVEELNFSLNNIARGLKNSHTRKIAVVIPRISRSFFSDVLDGIHFIAEKRGYFLQIAESYDDLDKESQMIDAFVAQWTDGIILASSISDLSNSVARKYIHKLQCLQKKNTKIPVVTLEFALSSGIDAVIVDNRQAAYDAVVHLVKKLKRKKILYMGLPEKSFLGAERLLGYKQALQDHQIEPDNSRVIKGEYTTYSGYIAMKEALKKNIEADALFCANDQMAIGAIKACQELDIRIPEDIAVIGMDDIYASSLITPSLSSVCFPKKELGKTAMNRLADILEQSSDRKYISEHQYLPYKIKERQTTDKNAVGFGKIQHD